MRFSSMIKITMTVVLVLVVFGLAAQVGTIVTTGQVNQAQENPTSAITGLPTSRMPGPAWLTTRGFLWFPAWKRPCWITSTRSM